VWSVEDGKARVGFKDEDNTAGQDRPSPKSGESQHKLPLVKREDIHILATT
jgi:hypothetical protein